jgi:hypothetical protein
MTKADEITCDKSFWDDHGRVGLVWSNPEASDDTLIAAALLKQPNFHLLLDIAARFGLERLKSQWDEVKRNIEDSPFPEGSENLGRAKPIVERCLASMEGAK